MGSVPSLPYKGMETSAASGPSCDLTGVFRLRLKIPPMQDPQAHTEGFSAQRLDTTDCFGLCNGRRSRAANPALVAGLSGISTLAANPRCGSLWRKPKLLSAKGRKRKSHQEHRRFVGAPRRMPL